MVQCTVTLEGILQLCMERFTIARRKGKDRQQRRKAMGRNMTQLKFAEF